MSRNYDNEIAWEKQTYKRFTLKLRKDSTEYDKLEKLLQHMTFSEFVKEAIKKEDNN